MRQANNKNQNHIMYCQKIAKAMPKEFMILADIQSL